MLTPYNGQLDTLSEMISSDIELLTADRFQGRDKPCIIMSLTRFLIGPTSFCHVTQVMSHDASYVTFQDRLVVLLVCWLIEKVLPTFKRYGYCWGGDPFYLFWHVTVILRLDYLIAVTCQKIWFSSPLVSRSTNPRHGSLFIWT